MERNYRPLHFLAGKEISGYKVLSEGGPHVMTLLGLASSEELDGPRCWQETGTEF